MNENQTVESSALFHLLPVCGNQAGLRLQPGFQLPWRGLWQPQLPRAVVLSNASGGGRSGGGQKDRTNRYEGKDDVGHASKVR